LDDRRDETAPVRGDKSGDDEARTHNDAQPSTPDKGETGDRVQHQSASKRSRRRRRRKRGKRHGDAVASQTVTETGAGDGACAQPGSKENAPNSVTPNGGGQVSTSAGEGNPASAPASGRKRRTRARRRRGGKGSAPKPLQTTELPNTSAQELAAGQAAPQAQSAPEQQKRDPGADAPQQGARRVAAPATPRRKQDLYAALDLGTNNCRLLIAEPLERGFKVVDAFSRIVRLGEGISHSGRLSDDAMDRAISALHVCRKKLSDRGVERARLIATEACRIADNGEGFITRIEEETGLALEIVNRETEARLAVAGCATLIDREAEGVVLFDIGGGSSELVWLDLRNRTYQRGVALTRFIRSWMSLPLGVVTLSERHGGVHVTPEIFEEMVADVLEALEGFGEAESLAKAVARGQVHMLGTSGTVTTLAGIHLDLARYDRRRVDGTWLEGTAMTAMIQKLVAMPFEERVANPCIGADRADLVLAGCAILEAIHRKWPCPRLRVADRGLREGILVELMAADGVWRRRRSRTRRPR